MEGFRDDVDRRRFTWPQYINIGLGLWLVASTFVWAHAASSRVNTWIVGIVIAVVAASALVRPKLHRLNSFAAAWLVVSTLVIHHLTNGTAWDNALIGLLVLGYSVATDEHLPSHPRQRIGHV
jgi:hypothetical protein